MRRNIGTVYFDGATIGNGVDGGGLSIKNNRKVLVEAMASAGFRNYAREYWHYSYGDAYWAVRRKEKVAIYGIPK